MLCVYVYSFIFLETNEYYRHFCRLLKNIMLLLYVIVILLLIISQICHTYLTFLPYLSHIFAHTYLTFLPLCVAWNFALANNTIEIYLLKVKINLQKV